MKAESEKRISLYLEWFILLFLAGIVSLLFFISSLSVIEQGIERYYRNRNLSHYYNRKYVTQIQEYITEQNISSKELDKLDAWVRDNRLIYVQIEKNHECIYSSDTEMDELQSDAYDSPEYPADSYYDVLLKDGTAQMFIMGMYSDKLYVFALIADIVVSFFLFFLLTMIGIRKKIDYINQLSRDIEILEGGNLEYAVHVQGDDELADLARGVNAMKDSFKNQIETVESLTRTNQKMVTEISHDLRTPLTSVLLYAEILQSGKYGDEPGKQDYLKKIVRKIQHMKDLSDKLLAYSASVPEEKTSPACLLPVQEGLYDELSDMCGYLQEQGISVRANLRWEEGSIRICREYLVRILDNIASNILKYADAQGPVLIQDAYCADEMCVAFENACGCAGSGDGYSIGIRNVKMMMQEMGGSCEVEHNREIFRISLRFCYQKEANERRRA